MLAQGGSTTPALLRKPWQVPIVPQKPARSFFGGDAIERFRFTAPSSEAVVGRQRAVESRRLHTYRAMQQANEVMLDRLASVPAHKRTVVRNATINVGQLDIAGLVRVPYAAERQELFASVFADAIANAPACSRAGVHVPEGPIDIIQVQELWLPGARAAMRAIADKLGYTCALDEEITRYYGLQILVRKRPDFRIVESGVKEFVKSNGRPVRAIFDALYRCRRGYANVVIELPNGKRLNVSTTHLSPLPKYEMKRALQMRELAATHNTIMGDCDFALHGADLNTPDSTHSKNRALAQTQAAEDLLDLYSRTTFADAWACKGRHVTTGTMNHHFAQFLNGDFDMRGRRIDYALTAAKHGSLLATLDYRTLLGAEYETSRGLRPFSDHLLIATTHVLA